jgi:hypothetical protein
MRFRGTGSGIANIGTSIHALLFTVKVRIRKRLDHL